MGRTASAVKKVAALLTAGMLLFSSAGFSDLSKVERTTTSAKSFVGDNGIKKAFTSRSLSGLTAWFSSAYNPLTSSSTAYHDGAVQFTASDKAYLSIADASQTGLDPGTGDYSYSFWVNPTTVTLSALIAKETGILGYALLLNANGSLTVYHGDDVSAWATATSSAGVITTGSWQQLTVVANRAGNLYVYKNGNTASPVLTLDISARNQSINTTTNFFIGNDPLFGSYYFNGAMDSLGFWNKALSAAEVTSLYNAGVGKIHNDIVGTTLETGNKLWLDFNEEGGTRYDASGNGNHLSQVFANIIDNTSTLGTEAVTNGTFTTNTDGWTAADSTIASVAGGQSGNALGITGTGVGYGGAYTSFTTTVNQNYTLSFYFKKGTGTSGSVLVGTTAGSSNVYLLTGLTDANWTLKTVNFKATSTTTYLYLANTGTTGTSLFDTVSVKPLTQTNLNGGFESLGSGETLGSELLSNTGFESAGAGGADIWLNWTEVASDGALADETTLFHGGAHAAKVTAGASVNTNVSQTITVTASTRYKLTFWSRGDGTYAGQYSVWDASNSANIVAGTSTGVTGTTYAQVTKYFTTPVGCTSISLYLWNPSTNGGIAYFDDVSIKQVTAYAPFLNWTIAPTGSSTVSIETTAPYAGTYAVRIDHDNTANGVLVYQSALTLTHKYKITVYAKAASGTPLLYSGDAGTGQVVWTLSTSYAQYTGYFTANNILVYFASSTANAVTYIDQATLTCTEIPSTAGIAAGLSRDGNLCASFNGTTQYLSRASDAKLSPGASNFTVWGWVNISSGISASSDMGIIAKYIPGALNRGYLLEMLNGYFDFRISPDGTNFTTISDTAPVSHNEWNFVIAWYDGAKIYISVNNRAALSTAYTSGVFDNSATPFTIGGAGSAYLLSGRADGVGFIKRTLTAAERTALFNLGKGANQLTDLPATMQADSSLLYWPLDEHSAGTGAVTRLDATSNGMDLTDTGNTPSGQGVDYYEGTVSKWLDQSGNAANLTQTTQANRLLYVTNAQNGKPVLRGDGLTKSLYNATDLIGTGAKTIVAVVKPISFGGANGGRIIDTSGGAVFLAQSLDLGGTSNSFSFSSNNGSTYVSSANNSITVGTAYVVIVTRSAAGLVNFYINGALSGSADQNSGTPTAGSATYLGNNSGLARGFDGDIDELGTYNRILSQPEIARLTAKLRDKWGI